MKDVPWVVCAFITGVASNYDYDILTFCLALITLFFVLWGTGK